MLGVRTAPHCASCNKKGQRREWHWPMNQMRISLTSLVLFLGRRIFVFRRSGLFFRLGSRSAVGLFGCALARGPRLRSAFLWRTLVSSRLGSWFAGRVRFGSRTRPLCFWRAFFGRGLMRFWLGSWFAGCVRFRSWTRLLCFWCTLSRCGLMRFWRWFAGRVRLGGRVRLLSFRCAFLAPRSFVSRTFFARSG